MTSLEDRWGASLVTSGDVSPRSQGRACPLVTVIAPVLPSRVARVWHVLEACLSEASRAVETAVWRVRS